MSEAVGTPLGQQLQIRDIEESATVVLTLLVPHLNSASSDEVKEHLKQAVAELTEKANKTRFVLNLGHVGVLDSSGLAVLISLKKRIDAGGGSLAICHLCMMISRLFELTGLHRAFEIFETEEEAVRGA